MLLAPIYGPKELISFGDDVYWLERDGVVQIKHDGSTRRQLVVTGPDAKPVAAEKLYVRANGMFLVSSEAIYRVDAPP